MTQTRTKYNQSKSKICSILVVDLDHTLIKQDLLISSIKWLAKHKPLRALLIPFWLIKSNANLKEQLYKALQLDVSKLRYNKKVIDYIKSRKNKGHSIILATASVQSYADEVSKYLGLFDKSYGTKDGINLSSKTKAKFLVAKYGAHQFDYIGDHRRDISVWQAANLAIIVNPNKKLKRKIKRFNYYVLN